MIQTYLATADPDIEKVVERVRANIGRQMFGTKANAPLFFIPFPITAETPCA